MGLISRFRNLLSDLCAPMTPLILLPCEHAFTEPVQDFATDTPGEPVSRDPALALTGPALDDSRLMPAAIYETLRTDVRAFFHAMDHGQLSACEALRAKIEREIA